MKFIKNNNTGNYFTEKSKFLFVIVLTMVLLITSTACGNLNNDNNSIDDVATVSEFQKTARQEAINECCNYSNVSKVSIEFGTFDVNTGGELWEADMAGYYYPIDKYGEYGDRCIFEIKVTCPSGSLYPLRVDPKISKKRY